MEDDTKISIPLLTADNFLEWNFKMKNILRGKGLYDLVIGIKVRNETGQYVSAAFSQDLKNKALGIIAPRIHKSLISTVSANGGDDDPVVLWLNINSFCSSKKEANIFRAYRNLTLLEVDPNNLAGSILKFRDAIAELKSLDEALNDRQTAHMILSKIPPSLAYIRDSIISTGQSNTVVTFDLVLDMLDNKAKTLSVPSQHPQTAVKTEPAESESDAASALLTYKCRDGRHNPSENHTAEQCFALHPNLLDEYRTRLKLRKLKTHPATHLTSAFSSAITRMPANDNISEGHESDISLL